MCYYYYYICAQDHEEGYYSLNFVVVVGGDCHVFLGYHDQSKCPCSQGSNGPCVVLNFSHAIFPFQTSPKVSSSTSSEPLVFTLNKEEGKWQGPSADVIAKLGSGASKEPQGDSRVIFRRDLQNKQHLNNHRCDPPTKSNCDAECLETYDTYFDQNKGVCQKTGYCAPIEGCKGTANCFATSCYFDSIRGACLLSTITGILADTCDGYNQRRQLHEVEQHDKLFTLVGQDHEKEQDPTIPMDLGKDQSVLGFVRVPKTGSTTVMKFLDSAKQMYPWNSHLPTTEDSPQQNQQGKAGACVFGHAPTTAHLGTLDMGFWNQCPHIPYGKMVKQWARTLPAWSPTHWNSEQESITMTFDAFSMFREPFDRLVSYFYYLRKFSETSKFLNHTITEAQYKCILENDLAGFMELLHTEGGRGLELPFQYKYIHEDVDMAIALIQVDASPRVYPLMMDCMETSLRLLTENACCFEPRAVDNFIESDEFKSNSNEASNDDKPNMEELEELKAKAAVWFEDDVKFYKAALEVFQQELSASRLQEWELETCSLWKSSQSALAAE